VWRLAWDDAAVMGVVLDVAGTNVSVAPATFESPDDPVTVVVPAADWPIGADLHIWHRLATDVPLGVLLAPIGAVPDRYLAPGAEVDAVFGAATALMLADLVPETERLAQAVTIAEPPPAVEAVAFTELLADRATSEVAAATGIPMATITAFRRGRQRPTVDQASRLAAYLDVPVRVVSGRVSIPAALIEAVQRPAHRLSIRARAARQAISEAVARLLVAEEVVARPARTTGTVERDVDAWDELVRQHLHE
jgi:transcriptional regulator with XRE-family HTH domain